MLLRSIDRFAGRVRQVYLEVRPSNRVAFLLYRKLSFEETGKVRKRYYPNGEDAIEMERSVARSTPVTSAVATALEAIGQAGSALRSPRPVEEE